MWHKLVLESLRTLKGRGERRGYDSRLVPERRCFRFPELQIRYDDCFGSILLKNSWNSRLIR